MTALNTYRRALYLALLLALALPLHAQDISRYFVSEGGDMFKREVDAALRGGAADVLLPRLDCAVEYLRRTENDEIVYRRGPIDLHFPHHRPALVGQLRHGTAPAAGDEHPYSFHGGMLLELPRAGEASDVLALSPDAYRYMLRVAIVPESYAAATLRARVILERAVVVEKDGKLSILNSEVFSRPVELQGNLPLKFDLPPWDALSSDGAPLLPVSLHEAVLLTLETPRYFALPPNLPEPFDLHTRLSYAVPMTSHVRLAIVVEGEEIVLDEGKREAGTYDVAWTANELPDGAYSAVLTARNTDGELLFHHQRTLTKSMHARVAKAPADIRSEPQHPMSLPRLPFLFAAGIESGLAFQFPADAARGLRNMFTHVAFRAGMRVLPWMEIGIVAGQDAFHEYPDERVDTEKITDYGGVVAWTYGYAGPYVRILVGTRSIVPYLQISTVWSDVATAAELGGGIRVALWQQVDGYIGPALLTHFRDDVSSKIGLHYGMTVRF